MDARQQIQDSGISTDRIRAVKTDLRETAVEMFDAYDVDLPNTQRVVDHLHTHLLETIVAQAEGLDEPITDRFEIVEKAFASGGSKARSNVSYLVSDAAQTNSDVPDAIDQLSMAFVAKNYERAPSTNEE